MFDGDVGGLDAAGAFAAAAELRATADHPEARLLQVAAHIADLHPGPEHATARTPLGGVLPGMERAVVHGGDGCPAMAEFAADELGAAIGISSGAAQALIGDALALRHRFPRTWARVLAGEVTAWRARKIATACLALSREAAALVDARVHQIVQSVTPWRLDQILKAAVIQADPDRARADADRAARERGVWVGQSDLHGTKTLVMKAAAGDVIRFDAATDHIADLLETLGDPDTRDARRAKAVGWLADPQAALALWDTCRTPDHDTPTTDAAGRRDALAGRLDNIRRGGTVQSILHVHLTDHTLATGHGVLRVDHLGPLLATQLGELLGHRRFVVKPVIDLHEQISVDAYEIPDRIREHLQLRYPTCVFPWCNRPSVDCDLDHIVPYDDTGPPGQTSTENLAPGCRRHHRAKTHGGWRYQRLPDGAFEWTSPHGARYRVDHTGTQHLPDAV